jgi:hypothetical protein
MGYTLTVFVDSLKNSMGSSWQNCTSVHFSLTMHDPVNPTRVSFSLTVSAALNRSRVGNPLTVPRVGGPEGLTSPLKAATRIGRSHYSQRGNRVYPVVLEKSRTNLVFFSIDGARQDGSFSKPGTLSHPSVAA